MVWRRESPARVNGIWKNGWSGEEKVQRGSTESGKMDDLEKRKSGAGQWNLENQMIWRRESPARVNGIWKNG